MTPAIVVTFVVFGTEEQSPWFWRKERNFATFAAIVVETPLFLEPEVLQSGFGVNYILARRVLGKWPEKFSANFDGAKQTACLDQLELPHLWGSSFANLPQYKRELALQLIMVAELEKISSGSA